MAERAQILIRAKDETAGAFSSVQRNFSSVHSTLAQLAPQIATALSVGGVIAFAKSAIDSADALNDMSQKTGLSVESLSKWKVVAEQSNTSLEAMVPGFKGLATNMEAAARGGKEQADAFARLGVPVRDAAGGLRGMDAVMLDLADRFSKMPDGANKSALAVRLFGRAGLEMVPLLNQGRAGIADLMQAAEDMGVVISTEAAAAADEFNDSLGLIKTAVSELSVQFVNSAAPAISQVARVMADAARQGGVFAAVVRGYGEAWKVLLFGSDPSQIDQQRAFIEDTEKRLAAARSRLNAAMQDAQRFPDAVSPEVMNRLRTEVAGLELTAQAAKQSLDLMEAKRSIQAPAVDVDPDAAERRRKHNEALLKHQQLTWDQMVDVEERGWKELDEIRKSGTIDKMFPANTLPEPPLNALGLTAEVMEMYRERARVASESLGVEVQKHNELAAAKQREADQRASDLASLMDELRTERQVIEQDYAEKSLLLKASLDNNLITQSQYYDFAKRLDERYTNDKLKLKSAETQRLQLLVNSAKKGELSGIAGLFNEAIPLMQSGSKTMFRIGKAAALAGAIVSTAQAVTNAMAVTPFPVGLALAALAAAKGMVQIQAIRAAEIGGGATPVFSADPGTGLPTSQFPSFEAPLSPSAQQAIAPQPRNIFVSLQGSGRYSSEEVRNLLQQLSEEMRDQVRLVVN